jgi:hypothetical protein
LGLVKNGVAMKSVVLYFLKYLVKSRKYKYKHLQE